MGHRYRGVFSAARTAFWRTVHYHVAYSPTGLFLEEMRHFRPLCGRDFFSHD
jgi:hypothetical protein